MDNTTMAITINIDSTTEEESAISSDAFDAVDVLQNDGSNASYLISSYSYPLENQDQYKAKISFRLMEIVSPVQVGNEGAEYVKKAKSSFKSSRDKDKSSRDEKKLARGNKHHGRNLENRKKSADWTEEELELINYSIEQNKKLTQRRFEDAERLREESEKHAKDGAESLNLATEKFSESFKFSDRQVVPATNKLKDSDGRETSPGVPVPGIQLYLPVGFQQNDSFQISGTELGLLGGGALAGMIKGDSILKTTLDQFKNGVGSVFDMMAGGLQPGQAAVVGARLANKLAPREVADAFSIAAGVTVNPNLRSIFKGVNLREYTFQFKFLPKSQKEAREVENIIKHFRVHSYPDIIPVGNFAAGYKYPNLFRIAVYVEHEDEIIGFDEEGNEYTESVKRRKRVGNRMKDCYLRAVSTNYNPSSMAFHPDGRPVEIDLSLSFVEEVTVNRRDVEEGY